MKRQPKTKIVRKWNDKIDKAKKAYNFIKSVSDEKLPPFKETPQYKDIVNRKERAIKRLKYRDIENENRRIKYQRVKEQRESEGDFKKLSDVSVFEAFSGVGRLFENNMRKSAKGSKFLGIVEYNGKEFKFIDVNKYSIFVNKILAILYGTKDANGGDYNAFHWRVQRSYLFKPEENKFFSEHIFYNENEDLEEDENEEIEF